MTEPTADNTTDLIVRKVGRAGRITLNRPKALNALTYDQTLAIERTIDSWSDDPEVQLIILDGTGERALCAGGDVLALYEKRDDGGDFAAQFWRDEYRLNAKIGRYPKPFIAIMDGIVMGGGIGLSGHASHRIVTERSALAMPETGIGLVPDVGGMWLLANAPGHLGEYLGLLGERMAAGDAIYAGFADTFVSAERVEELIAELVDPAGDPIGVCIASLAEAPPSVVHAARQDEIDLIFGRETLEAVVEGLTSSQSDWAATALKTLGARSPLALKLTLAAVRRARQFKSLEEALNLEYRLTCRLFVHGEFIEGIRALLIDKDKTPKWRPGAIESVSAEMVDRFLAPLTEREELGLEPSHRDVR
ncbi:MAG: enoyl-CoA hydratase/isomerase family protein [Hyphomicrobiaceae bacterium]